MYKSVGLHCQYMHNIIHILYIIILYIYMYNLCDPDVVDDDEHRSRFLRNYDQESEIVTFLIII